MARRDLHGGNSLKTKLVAGLENELLYGAIEEETSLAQAVSPSNVTVPENITYFIKIEGVRGNSELRGYEGWFELDSYQLGMGVGISSPRGGDRTASRPSFSELSIALSGNAGLAALLSSATSDAIDAVQIHGVVLEKNSATKVFDLIVNDVVVSSVNTAGSNSGEAAITATLAYSKIGMFTYGLDVAGGPVLLEEYGWDLSTNAPVNPGALFDPEDTRPVQVPSDLTYFVKIDGISGDSTDPRYEGWFEIGEYQLGLIQTVSAALGGELSVGKLSFPDLNIQLEGDSGLADLLAAVTSGTPISSVQIHGVSGSSKAGETIVDLKLNNVLLSGVSTSTGEGEPSEINLSLNYDKIGLTTLGFTPGGAKVVENFGWDLVRNEAIAPESLSSPDPSPPVVIPDGLTYYIKIDGVAGSSLAKGYDGWFELDSYEFGVGVGISQQGGDRTVSKPSISELTAYLSGNSGLADLLGDLSDAEVLTAVQIHGVSQTGGGAQVVLDLRLNDVIVSGVSSQSSSGDEAGLALSFNYTKIGLLTNAVSPDGKVRQSDEFGFDLSKYIALDPRSLAEPQKNKSAQVPDELTYYVKLDGIAGDATAEGFEGWFELDSYSLGAGLGVSSALGGDRTTSQPSFSELQLTLTGNAGTAALFQAGTSVVNLPAVQVVGVSGQGKQQQVVYDLRLNDVIVSGVGTVGGSETEANQSLSLNYVQIGLTTSAIGADGKTVVTHEFGFDRALSQMIDPSMLAQPSHDGSISVPVATTYFIRIDGVSGDSTAAGYEGWFEVAHYSLGMGVGVSSPQLGDRAIGVPSISDLNVILDGDSGLADLLTGLASAEPLAAVQIHGVTGNGKSAQVVFDMRLNDVIVSNVNAVAADGIPSQLGVSFNFAEFGIATFEQAPGNKTQLNSAFGWDRLANKSVQFADLSEPDPEKAFRIDDDLTYFLNFEGLTGDSQVDGFEGWFEISSYQFGAGLGVSSASGGERTTSLPSFSEVTLTLDGNLGLASLFKNASTYETAQVKIMGVSSSGNSRAPAFEMVLQDVLISSVNSVGLQEGESQFSVSLNYTAIGITSFRQPQANAKNSEENQKEFGWDLVRGEIIDPDTLISPGDPAGWNFSGQSMGQEALYADGLDLAYASHVGLADATSDFIFA